MCSSSLLFTRLRMPSFSSCTRNECHTRGGGATSEGRRCAAEIILLRSTLRLRRRVRSPKGVRIASGRGGRPLCFRSICAFLCCMTFPPSTEHQVTLAIDSNFLATFSSKRRAWNLPASTAKRLTGFRRLLQPRPCERRVRDFIGFNLRSSHNNCGEASDAYKLCVQT